jgi:uncharacterized protein (TIGR02266 family)
VDFQVRVRQSAGEVVARAVNLSSEGICIHTATTLRQGDQIEVLFRLPDVDHELDAVARVKWILDMKHYEAWGCGVGILFEQIQPSARAALAKYISGRLNY